MKVSANFVLKASFSNVVRLSRLPKEAAINRILMFT